MRFGKSIMALVADRGFRRNLGTGKSLSFVRTSPMSLYRRCPYCTKPLPIWAVVKPKIFNTETPIFCPSCKSTISYSPSKRSRATYTGVGIALGYLADKFTHAMSGGSILLDLLMGSLLLVGIVLFTYYFAQIKNG